MEKKYGIVAFLGRPNTGKSTLLNAIMGQKVAITSPLPQTTRKNIKVFYEDERGKLILTDTPGLLGKVTDLMGKRVNEEIPKILGQMQVVVMVVDISRPKNEEENKVIGIIRKLDCKKILVYNKIDKAKGPKDHLAEYNFLEEEFDKTVAVSALKEKNIKELIKEIFELLPRKTLPEIKKEIENFEDKDRPLIRMGASEYVAEIIREKAYLFLRDEVPYSIQVVVENIEDKGKMIIVSAVIYTTADRYKKMIIGKGGQKIKEIGYNARKELELMSQKKIFLDLEVKTDKHWMENFEK